MAYNEFLADQIRQVLKEKRVHYREQTMFGGLAFMLDDKMTVGIVKDDLMVRVGPVFYDQALEIEGCREMDFTGRSMKGFVYADPDVWESSILLKELITFAIKYNPDAPRTKKRN